MNPMLRTTSNLNPNFKNNDLIEKLVFLKEKKVNVVVDFRKI